MGKRVAIRAIVGTLVICIVVTGNLLWQRHKQDDSPSHGEHDASMNLGVTYMPLIPELAVHYGIGIDHGDMVTSVAPRSLADRAGIKEGNIILSFNGIELNQSTSLLSMLRSNLSNGDITLEVWSRDHGTFVQLIHKSN